MRKYFETVISVEDYEKPKPDPEPLILACRRLRPNQCVYVGDALSDLQAAKAAGMKFVLCSRDRKIKADARIASLSELPKLVAKLD